MTTLTKPSPWPVARPGEATTPVDAKSTEAAGHVDEQPVIAHGTAAPPVASPLAPAPPPSRASRRMHAMFLKVNRWTAIPLLRAGLGSWLGTPIGGYMLLLRARGRTSGNMRETPLSYLIAEGAAWVCAGMGPRTQWYRNIEADPRVEVVLPGRTVSCMAAEERDPDIRRRIMPTLVRAIGLPGALGGIDPRRATDERIIDAYGWVPLIRLAPLDGPLAAGPDDPGGSAWMWRQVVVLGSAIAIVRSMLRIARRAGGAVIR